MSYDSPPNFANDIPFDAWWFYSAGEQQACATHGASVVASIRRVLGLSPTSTWDDALQAALIRRLDELVREDATWSNWRAALVADASARRVSNASMTVGIYLAYYRPYARQFNALSVPDSAVMPAWNVPVPAITGGSDGGQSLACWVIGSQPPTGTSRAEVTERSRSRSGVLMAPGDQLPSDLLRAPATSGIPWWGIALGGVVLAGGVGVLIWKTKS
jgi:hypothetical protein